MTIIQLIKTENVPKREYNISVKKLIFIMKFKGARTNKQKWLKAAKEFRTRISRKSGSRETGLELVRQGKRTLKLPV